MQAPVEEAESEGEGEGENEGEDGEEHASGEKSSNFRQRKETKAKGAQGKTWKRDGDEDDEKIWEEKSLKFKHRKEKKQQLARESDSEDEENVYVSEGDEEGHAVNEDNNAKDERATDEEASEEEEEEEEEEGEEEGGEEEMVDSSKKDKKLQSNQEKVKLFFCSEGNLLSLKADFTQTIQLPSA